MSQVYDYHIQLIFIFMYNIGPMWDVGIFSICICTKNPIWVRPYLKNNNNNNNNNTYISCLRTYSSQIEVIVFCLFCTIASFDRMKAEKYCINVLISTLTFSPHLYANVCADLWTCSRKCRVVALLSSPQPVLS